MNYPVDGVVYSNNTLTFTGAQIGDRIANIKITVSNTEIPSVVQTHTARVEANGGVVEAVGCLISNIIKL